MKAPGRNVITAASALLASVLLAAPATAGFAPVQDEEEKEAEEAEEAEGTEAEDDKYYAVIGGDIHTGTGAVLRGATLLAKNGVIEEIGYDVFLPEGTEKLDARGMRVYPGLVALNATTRVSRGLFAAELEDEWTDWDPIFDVDGPEINREVDDLDEGPPPDDHWNDIFTDPSYSAPPTAADEARIKAEDSFDPYSQYMVMALGTGITTVEQSNVAIKLLRYEFKGTFMNEKSMTNVSWSKRTPSSITSAKEKFAAAAKYLREYRAWEALNDKDVKEPSKRGVDSGILRILKGEALARFGSNDREEILGIARLAQTYGFRPVIVGCREGWTVAEELGRAGAYAIVTPRDRRAKDESLVRPGGTGIENAAILHRSGVQVAVVPANTSFDLGGITGRDLMHLPVEAGFAVRGGLSDVAALQALTLVPARLLGVSHRVGSLEVGKDCDVIVTDGDVLHYQTFVQYAVVMGKLVYDKQEELFYAHIRPRQELPPLDPGEEAAETEATPPEAEEEGGEDETTESEIEEGEDEEKEGDGS